MEIKSCAYKYSLRGWFSSTSTTTTLPALTLTRMLSKHIYCPPLSLPNLENTATATSNVVWWLQLSTQHHFITDWKTEHSDLEYRNLQLDIGLPHKQASDSSDWQIKYGRKLQSYHIYCNILYTAITFQFQLSSYFMSELVSRSHNVTVYLKCAY